MADHQHSECKDTFTISQRIPVAPQSGHCLETTLKGCEQPLGDGAFQKVTGPPVGGECQRTVANPTSSDIMVSCAPLMQIPCGGYLLQVSDSLPFYRFEVESVKVQPNSNRCQSRLDVPPVKKIRLEPQNRTDFGEDAFFDHWDETTGGHVCKENAAEETLRRSASFPVSNRCNGWESLTEDQQNVLAKIQERVDQDRGEGRRFTCVIVEGPGGCGKTRLMAHITNHKQATTQVLYVTKQNKRVQDFVHFDCLNGEPDVTVQEPTDLSAEKSEKIFSIVGGNDCGRYALTAEKLVYALGGLWPKKFDSETTISVLGIDYGVFSKTEDHSSGQSSITDTSERKTNVIILMDEYTMLQPPLIHAVVFYVMKVSLSPVVLILGGDKHQCGPVGWDATDETTVVNAHEFSGNVRHEFVSKMAYTPLEVRMDNLERCKEDPALGICVKRLRNVCEAAAATNTRFNKKILGVVLAKYCVDSGVILFRRELLANGMPWIQRIVPSDLSALDFDDTEEPIEYDERGVAFELSTEPPINPSYDLLPLVEHFTSLYIKLAVLQFTHPEECHERLKQDILYRSSTTIRDLFPVFIVLRNKSCNMLAETFLLALYTQVRSRLLATPTPMEVAKYFEREALWTAHLGCILRQFVRSLTIDDDNPINRQTLFVGMIYKMTSTLHSVDGRALCNGERVVLMSLIFEDKTLEQVNTVALRRLDTDRETVFTLSTGHNENRLTNGGKMAVMPFVPYVSENIFQMQGNTMPKRARSFIDVVDAPSKSVYVAVSRFKHSESIKGIIISE